MKPQQWGMFQGDLFLGERAEVLGRFDDLVRAHGLGRRMAVPLILVGGFIASLVAPGSALAGIASSDGSNVSYVAADGEQNNITVELAGATYTITDSGAPVTATAPCVSAGANSATCPQS